MFLARQKQNQNTDVSLLLLTPYVSPPFKTPSALVATLSVEHVAFLSFCYLCLLLLSICLHYNLTYYVTENIGQNLKFTLIQAACQSQGLAYGGKSEHCLPCQNQCLVLGNFLSPWERGPLTAHPDVQSLVVYFQTVPRNPVHMDVVVEVLHARTL